MAKRRSVMLGLGALATGSGAAFSSATFQNTVEPDADFRVIAAAQTVVRRGPAFGDGDENEDWAEDGFLNFDDLNPDDLPVASANQDENDDLSVSLARGNSANEFVFENFLEIDNAGTTTVEIGITYATDSEVGYTEPTEEWWTEVEADYSDDKSETITRHDVLQMFQFNIPGDRRGELENESGGSDALISPDPETAGGEWDDGGDEEPDEFITLGPGESISVDMVTNLTGEQVNTFADEVGGGTGPNPFAGETAGFDLLDSVFVGTAEEEE